MATGTRAAARALWGDALPADRTPASLVRELYAAENAGQAEPSGSQDMIGLIYPGVNRLDYDASVEGGFFPAHIESHHDPEVARWLERVHPPGAGHAAAARLQPAGHQAPGPGVDRPAGRERPGLLRRDRRAGSARRSASR